MRSHRQVLSIAKEKKLSSVLILEDDIDFCEGFTEKLNKCLSELPPDWDALHLNGTDHPKAKSTFYSELLNKCHHTTGAFGIVINSTIYDYLISLLNEEQKLVDIYYAEAMRKLNWYRTKEKLVLHPAGFSEIKRKFVDYKHLR